MGLNDEWAMNVYSKTTTTTSLAYAYAYSPVNSNLYRDTTPRELAELGSDTLRIRSQIFDFWFIFHIHMKMEPNPLYSLVILTRTE